MRYGVIASLLLATSITAQERFIYPVDTSRVIVTKNNNFRGELTFDVYRPAGVAVVPVVIFANVGSLDYTTWPVYIGWAQACAGTRPSGSC